MIRYSRSPEETIAIGKSLAADDPKRSAFYLQGELGAGKTLMTKGIASFYGIDPSIVVSPTFALVNRYGGGNRVVYHIDLYRIESERELDELGLDDMEEEEAVLVVEWAEKLGRYRRLDAIEISLEVTGELERRIDIRTAKNPK